MQKVSEFLPDLLKWKIISVFLFLLTYQTKKWNKTNSSLMTKKKL